MKFQQQHLNVDLKLSAPGVGSVKDSFVLDATSWDNDAGSNSRAFHGVKFYARDNPPTQKEIQDYFL